MALHISEIISRLIMPLMPLTRKAEKKSGVYVSYDKGVILLVRLKEFVDIDSRDRLYDSGEGDENQEKPLRREFYVYIFKKGFIIYPVYNLGRFCKGVSKQSL